MDTEPAADRSATAGRRRGRTRDLGGWILVPLATLLVGVPAAGGFTFIALLGDSGGSNGQSTFCEAQAPNGCEEATLAWVGQCAVMFAVAWLLLWLIPWWRGLRPLRYAVAGGALLLLFLAPLRLIW